MVRNLYSTQLSPVQSTFRSDVESHRLQSLEQSLVKMQEKYEAILNDTYPLHHLASSWESIPWTNYDQLLVVGPQRSGTTWVAQTLASVLGYAYVDELGVTRDDVIALLSEDGPNATEYRRVIHKPSSTDEVHSFTLRRRQAVVFVARTCVEVIRSQNRIFQDYGGWTCAFGRTKELPKYKAKGEFAPFFDPRDPICKIKQDVWMKFQAPRIGGHAITVSYESFQSHPSYVVPKIRSNFGAKQVRVAD